MLGRRPLVTGGRRPGPAPARLRRVPTALVASAVAVSFLLGTACAAALTVTSKGLATGMLPVPAYGCTDTRSGDTPVSYWRLDETSGTSASDSTGGRTGTYTGGYTLNQTGALSATTDKAVTFNGTTGYVAVPYAAALNPAQFTLEAWAKPTGGAGTWRLVASSWTHPSGYQGYWVGIDSNDHWSAHLGNGVNTEANADGPTAVLNTWTHLVETYDGATLKLYVNGTLAGSTATTTYSPNTSPTQFEIGAEYFSGAQASYFPGSIDEVSFYNSVLTATKIRSHYNAERCYRDEVLVDSPLGYWRLGETSGDATARDAKSTYPGTYFNSPSRGQAGALNLDGDTSVTFNGTNNRVVVPYTAALNPAQVTVEAWAKPTGGSGTNRAIADSFYDDGAGTVRGFFLGIDSSNRWWLALGNGAAYKGTTGSTATLNGWSHVVGTFDGTTAKLYVNGILAGSAAASYAANAVQPVTMGAWPYLGSWVDQFTGSIDEVAVYGSALSQTRVQAHYLRGRSYNDTVLDSGPVSYWRLGESSGTSAADGKGSNTGTYTNGPTLAQSGALAGDSDTSVSFDGSNDYVKVPASASLNITAAITMEAWIYKADTSTSRPLLEYNTGSGWGIHLWNYDDGTKLYVNLVDSGGGNHTVMSASGVFSAGQWYHVVTTYDGNTGILYVNGPQVASATLGSFTLKTNMDFYLGTRASDGTASMFSGRIDDVALYNRALTATEVQLHYDSGRQ